MNRTLVFVDESTRFCGRSRWAAMMGRAFIWSLVLILGLTGLAKLLSAAGHARILQQPDPVLGFANSHVLFGVGVVELIVVGYMIFGKATKPKYYLSAWLALNFIGYRILSAQMAPDMNCPCLGMIGDMLPVSRATADLLLKIVVVYMLLGSLLFWFAPIDTSRPKLVHRRIDKIDSK